jgi:hypothetical protein
MEINRIKKKGMEYMNYDELCNPIEKFECVKPTSCKKCGGINFRFYHEHIDEFRLYCSHCGAFRL